MIRGQKVNTGSKWGNTFTNIEHEHEYSLVDVAREWETALANVERKYGGTSANAKYALGDLRNVGCGRRTCP